jgi:hypothetical protein
MVVIHHLGGRIGRISDDLPERLDGPTWDPQAAKGYHAQHNTLRRGLDDGRAS